MKYNSIQFLRAIASLLVVNVHISYLIFEIHLGRFGVDIFFIVSGCMMSIILKSNSNNFFLRRFIRIFPMYFIFTLLQFLQLNMPLHNVYYNNSIYDFFKSIFFITTNPQLGIGWSLNIEVFFYSIIAIVALFFSKINIKLFTSLIVLFFYILLNIIGNPEILIPISHLKNSIIFELILGFYIIEINLKKNSLILFNFIALFLLIIMLYFESYNFVNEQNRFLLFGVPSFFLVLIFINNEIYFEESKFVNFFQRIGDSSYIIYLMHSFIILAFSLIFYKIVKLEPGSLNFYFKFIVYILIISIVLKSSYLIHKYVEMPITQYFKRLFKIK